MTTIEGVGAMVQTVVLLTAAYFAYRIWDSNKVQSKRTRKAKA